VNFTRLILKNKKSAGRSKGDRVISTKENKRRTFFHRISPTCAQLFTHVYPHDHHGCGTIDSMKQLLTRSFFKLVAGFWGILTIGIISLFVAGVYYGQESIPDTSGGIHADYRTVYDTN